MASHGFAPAEHDRALDLASDRADFGLDPSEERELTRHLDQCDDCGRYAVMMDEAAKEIKGTAWRDDLTNDREVSDEDDGQGQDYGEADEFSPQTEGPAPPERAEPEPDAPRGAKGDDDEDDGEDDSPEPEGRHPLDRPDGQRVLDEDEAADVADEGLDKLFDDEPDAEPAEGLTDDDPPPEPEASDEDDEGPDVRGSGGQGDQSNDKTADAVVGQNDYDADAAREVEAMTDEELASVDEDEHEDDGVFEDCVADGVDEAAREHGVANVEWVHARAEQLVRNEDGLEVTPFGKVAVYRSMKGMRKESYHYGGRVKAEVSGRAAAAIRNAILRSRTGQTGTELHHKSGKLDGKSLHRVAARDSRLFKRNIAPDPGKYLVWVLVDVSGSMGGQPIVDAASVARSLAEATVGTPTVRLEVWGWSTPFIRNSHPGAYAGVVRVWQRGQPTSDIAKMADLPMGGTPDAAVMEWAWKEMLKHRRSDEQPVAIMCSDGWGDYSFPQAIANAVKHGVDVRNVALGHYVSEVDQEKRFGRGNFVPWGGSIEATARPLANMVAKMARGD